MVSKNCAARYQKSLGTLAAAVAAFDGYRPGNNEGGIGARPPLPEEVEGRDQKALIDMHAQQTGFFPLRHAKQRGKEKEQHGTQ